MEGITGVCHGEHTMRSGREHERARELMTGEVNAAVQGAMDAGATEVIVNDSHGTMRNIIPELLHKDAYLITGSPKHLSMMQGVDAECEGVIFVGYHARMGVPGVLSHTYDSSTVFNVRLNGQLVGEAALNAMVASHYGVPIIMLTGDKAAVEDSREVLGDFVGVAVKEAATRYSVKGVHPDKACEMIREGAKEAVMRRKEFKPFGVEKPITIEMEFLQSGMADMAEVIPGAVRVDGRKVAFTSDSPIQIYKAFRAMVTLAGSVL
jgi:D-amino peptidase